MTLAGESPATSTSPTPSAQQTATRPPSPTRPVRVLIVFNTVFLYGMERYVIELFDLLRPEVEPHFLLTYTTHRKQLPVLAEISARGLQHSFLSDWTDWPKIGRPRSFGDVWRMTVAMVKGNRDVLRRSLHCDVIYLPAVGYGYFALLGGLLHRLRRRAVVYCFHDLAHQRQFSLRVMCWLASHCVHSTRFGFEHTARSNPYIARKNTFICPGRTEAWRQVDPDPEVRKALAGKRNLLFVGQLSRAKGIDLLLEAFHLLAADYPDVQLHVLGAGAEEDAVRHEIASTGLDERVRLWGYRNDVHDFLSMAYVYVHPSPPSRFRESFGRGVVEAMSKGVPNVCFRSGALQEIVEHEQTGLVCEQETPACLAGNIRRFLDDSPLRARCSRRAADVFRERYSDERLRRPWIKFFGSILRR